MSRRRVMVGIPAALAILSAAAAGYLQPTGALAREKRVVAQGRVLTPSGDGMPGWPVHLIATQRYIEFRKYSSGGDVATAARVTTDANGYFSFDVPRERRFQFWFLRFADKDHLDPVKYLPLGDLEITADVRRGRVAWVDVTIRFHPDWPEVERRVAEEGGAQTERGRILRTLGLPEKTVRTEGSGEEEWWYFTKGILYTFRGSEPTGSRRFEPVKPPPGQDPAATPRGPEAVRKESR